MELQILISATVQIFYLTVCLWATYLLTWSIWQTFFKRPVYVTSYSKVFTDVHDDVP